MAQDRVLTEKTKRLSKIRLIEVFASFMSTEVYAEVVGYLLKGGNLCGADAAIREQINSLITSAENRAVQRFLEAMTEKVEP